MRNATIAIAPIANQNGTGSPSAIPSPSVRKPGYLPWKPTSLPPVSTSATPRSSSIEPSVTTKGGILKRAMIVPCAKPTTSAIASAIATAAPMPKPPYIAR